MRFANRLLTMSIRFGQKVRAGPTDTVCRSLDRRPVRYGSFTGGRAPVRDLPENTGAVNAVYGTFGGIMALLLWIYLSGCIFIFGDHMRIAAKIVVDARGKDFDSIAGRAALSRIVVVKQGTDCQLDSLVCTSVSG